MRKSVIQRIKITKNGKIIRRHMGIGHSQAKQSGTQKNRRKGTSNVKASDVKSFLRNL